MPHSRPRCSGDVDLAEQIGERVRLLGVLLRLGLLQLGFFVGQDDLCFVRPHVLATRLRLSNKDSLLPPVLNLLILVLDLVVLLRLVLTLAVLEFVQLVERTLVSPLLQRSRDGNVALVLGLAVVPVQLELDELGEVERDG